MLPYFGCFCGFQNEIHLKCLQHYQPIKQQLLGENEKNGTINLNDRTEIIEFSAIKEQRENEVFVHSTIATSKMKKVEKSKGTK